MFPPFDPNRSGEKRRRFGPVPVRTLVPNLITLLALCAGLTAIRVAFEGQLELALAALLAGNDRLARHHQQCNEEAVEESRPNDRETDRHAEEEQIDRQQHRNRAGRCRDAGEKITCPRRLVGIVDHHIEAREP
jgi:hypothetical protein